MWLRQRDSVVHFAVSYWRPHARIICLAAVTMVLATVLSLLIPITAKEVATYAGDTGVTEGGGDGAVDSVTAGAGRASEWLFGGRVVAAVTGGCESFLYGLVCRALLMAAVVVLYHVVSLVGHLSAYRAGMATQASMSESSLVRILCSSHPERIAVVNAVKLTQIISASAKTCGDTLGALLTDVLSSVFSAAGLLLALLYISTPLTVVIGVLVCLVQYVYFLSGRNQHHKGAAVATEESSAQASLCNALQRSETIFVFNCRPFVVDRLREKLVHVRDMAAELNLCIHGYAAVCSGATNLIFVVVLGMSNYYHRRGDIALMDVALYFVFLQQFVSRLLQLSKDVSQTRATLGRLRTLKLMLEWYEEEERDVAAPSGSVSCEEVRASHFGDCDGAAAASSAALRGRIIYDPTGIEAICLDQVSFEYPEVPRFFSEDAVRGMVLVSGDEGGDVSAVGGATGFGPSRGIRNVSFAIAPGSITALYGPSGFGKSTCLRLLGGLVRPHVGTVRTQHRVVLLEQQHAIFIGTVAENILLMDLSGRSGGSGDGEGADGKARVVLERRGGSWLRQLLMHQGGGRGAPASPGPRLGLTRELRERVHEATVRSGCATFLADPFSSLIENVDHPPFSGGQLQRICLARVFSGNHPCSFVLLDEPTTGLDAMSVKQLLVTIRELRDVHGKTVVISTHDHRVAEIADSVIELGK